MPAKSKSMIEGLLHQQSDGVIQAKQEALRELIVGRGGIEKLIALLASDTEEVQVAVLAALTNLASDEYRERIATAELVQLLLEFFGREHVHLRANSAGLIRILVGNDVVRGRIGNVVIEPLVLMLSDTFLSARASAAYALSNLSIDSPEPRARIVELGGIEGF
jgi:HEAT repeat protein